MEIKKLIGLGMSTLMLAGSMTSVYATTGDMQDLTPAQLAKEMTVGWNLGNSLDAYGSYSINNETYWGNPKTTKKMIDTVKAKGFNTIRIPVSWGEHMSGAPNYTVSADWMNRVQEVVDYAIDENTYVLLDTHHETNWLKPNSANLEASQVQLAALWTQIAERFKDYDEHLIFEGMNEPRIVGSSNEWSGGDAQGRAAVNALNKTFIEAVRKTGGNNLTRCLMICPYGNNADTNGLNGFEIPNDPNIMVAIHAYTPYGFTYRPEGNPSWAMTNWDGSAKNTIEDVMQKINDCLISKGVTVMITEFGAVNKNNESEVVKWSKDFMNIASEYGIKCVWWDNNYHKNDGESFGLLNRNACTWTRNNVANMLVKCAGESQESVVTPNPTPSTIPSTDGTVTVKVTSDWGAGAVADITIKNTTGNDLENWTCTFTTNRPITSVWNATLVSQSGNTYTIKASDWQPSLAADASYTLGCQMGEGTSDVSVTDVTLK